MRNLLGISVFLLGATGFVACGGTIVTPGGGTTGGTGAGTTDTTTTTDTSTTDTNTSSSCQIGCGGPCPQGSFCHSPDPCGDYASCMPFPPACAATPTCACLMSQMSQMFIGGPLIGCYGDGANVSAESGGDSPCCP